MHISAFRLTRHPPPTQVYFMNAMDSNNHAESFKRRRACDLCRRNKIRCNPPASRDIPCAHCAQANLQCTFQEESKKRAPPKGYVVSLENRCMRLEDLVRRIAPDLDLDAEVGPSFTQDTWTEKFSLYNQSRSISRTPSFRKPVVPLAASFFGSNSNAEDLPNGGPVKPDDTTQIKEELEELDLGKAVGYHFLGKHSGLDLIRTAFNLKETGDGTPHDGPEIFTMARAKFWAVPEWRKELDPKPSVIPITWPPDDLQEELINLYFDTGELLIPIVHRLSFESNFKRGLHKTDVDFSRLAALVFAIGSRFCDDPRVCIHNGNGEADYTSAGWPYFIQIHPLTYRFFGPCSLSHLQTLVLSVVYLQYVGAVLPAWLLSGIGVRIAVDIGLHVEKVYPSYHPLKSQAWRRTFWALICVDIALSASLGRPCAVALEEIEAALPLDVDYEHYDKAAQQWKQPPGLPPRTSGFVQFIKLHIVAARTSRTMYKVQDPNPIVVAEMDELLSSWHNCLPQHLRWDPDAQHPIFLQQAGILRLIFLHIQINLHRIFLPSMLPNALPSVLSTSAAAICSTAAQVAVRVLLSLRKAGRWMFPLSASAFEAAAILLFSIWDMERKDPSHIAISRWMQDIHQCMDILDDLEKRWQTGARLSDILKELSSITSVPPERMSHVVSRKRGRDTTEDDEGTDPPVVRGFRHHHLSSTSRPSSDQSVPIEGPSAMPLFSLMTGMHDISALQWDPSALEHFAPSMGTSFDNSGLSDMYGGTSVFYEYLQGVPPPNDTSQNLFGGLDDIYGAATHLSAGGIPYSNLHDANSGWASEGAHSSGPLGGPSNP